MKKDYTFILSIVDRSGSMSGVEVEASHALNTFIQEQRDLPGTCDLRVTQFDTPIADQPFPEVVFDGPIGEWGPYILVPRGMTALLDAVGNAVTNLGKDLAAMPEEERPEHVIVVIQTDGGENASHDWTKEQIQGLIKQQENDYNWQFVSLLMGPDAWSNQYALGTVNNIRASGTAQSYWSTYSTLSSSVTATRTTGAAIDLDVDTK